MKNKNTAAILAFIGGILGLHFFYLGRMGLGFMSIAFTMYWKPEVSVFIGIINAVILMTQSQYEFDTKYNRKFMRENPDYKERQAEYDEQRRKEQNERYKNRQQNKNNQQSQQNRNNNQQQQNNSSPKAKGEALKQAGLKNFKEYDYEEAKDNFRKALELLPADQALHFNLACCYSLLEMTYLGYYHLQKAVELGLKDFEKVKTHDALAYLRVQPDYDAFVQSGYKITVNEANMHLLGELQRIADERKRGMLSDAEMNEASRRLLY